MLNAVAVRIGDPGEAAVVVIAATGIDLDTGFGLPFEAGAEIVEAIVHHESSRDGPRSISRCREKWTRRSWPSDRARCRLGGLQFTPCSRCALTVGLGLEAEIFLIPGVKLLPILGLEGRCRQCR